MRNIALGLALIGLILCTGCAMVATPVAGFLYMDVKGPITATENTAGDKVGEATATTILGWVATGDASIDTAASNGGISEIKTVDHHSWQILGIYGKFTTRVTGK
ncbi:MAG: TRL-like family protein [Planctomycetota bacterium]